MCTNIIELNPVDQAEYFIKKLKFDNAQQWNCLTPLNIFLMNPLTVEGECLYKNDL